MPPHPRVHLPHPVLKVSLVRSRYRRGYHRFLTDVEWCSMMLCWNRECCYRSENSSAEVKLTRFNWQWWWWCLLYALYTTTTFNVYFIPMLISVFHNLRYQLRPLLPALNSAHTSKHSFVPFNPILLHTFFYGSSITLSSLRLWLSSAWGLVLSFTQKRTRIEDLILIYMWTKYGTFHLFHLFDFYSSFFLFCSFVQRLYFCFQFVYIFHWLSCTINDDCFFYFCYLRFCAFPSFMIAPLL